MSILAQLCLQVCSVRVLVSEQRLALDPIHQLPISNCAARLEEAAKKIHTDRNKQLHIRRLYDPLLPELFFRVKPNAHVPQTLLQAKFVLETDRAGINPARDERKKNSNKKKKSLQNRTKR